MKQTFLTSLLISATLLATTSAAQAGTLSITGAIVSPTASVTMTDGDVDVQHEHVFVQRRSLENAVQSDAIRYFSTFAHESAEVVVMTYH